VRILVISNLYPPYTIGGYEQACRDTVEGLRERGHHVEVLTSTYGLSRPAASRGVHRLISPFADWTGGAERPSSWQELWRWNVGSARSLATLFHVVRPDVVYVWSLRGLPSSLLIATQRAGMPIVFNLQDPWLLELPGRDHWVATWNYRSHSPLRVAAKAVLRSAIEPVASTRFPVLVGASAQYASHAFASLYAEEGWHFVRERVIYNGLDLAQFAVTPGVWSGGTCRLLCIGRLVAEKGAHVAIEALALLVQRRGHAVATLTIVGTSNDTDYQERLLRMVRAYGLDGLVEFRGAVPHAETAAVYAAHDILLFPSSWIEGFSLVLLEALACGLAVVGTTTGGSAEILRDAETALTVPPEDAEALARAVGLLLDDPALARRIATTGARTVREQFDQRHIVTQVEQFLRETAGAHRTWGERRAAIHA